jgi:hypothetical protein
VIIRPSSQHLATLHLSTPAEKAPNPLDQHGLVEYVRALADVYVADERFVANYGGIDGASFVRDALLFYVA